MAIVDNRTLVTNAQSGGFVDATGAASGATNTDFFIEGSGSHGVQTSQGTDALLFNFGSAQDFSNNHFYIWWLVTTAGLLDTFALGGVRIRFAGATIGNFFEVYIAGKDTYSGGFEMAVIDIETAAASPNNTGGTPPATSAIQYVGIFFSVPGMVPGNVPNCFVDAMWRLPANTPGILVEGQNTGPVDWKWNDIVSAADAGDTAKAWGTVFRRDGVIFLNTPIRFGANDATTHGFSDINEVVGWEDKPVATDFYNLEILGGSGAQSFSLGTRVGSGDASVGHSGCVFTAASAGQRYDIVASDANIDTCEFLGCTFSHTGTIDMSNANSEIRSSLISDGTALTHADAGGAGVYQKNTQVGANTADGVAYITTDNPEAIKDSSFVFSDGHAIEITATGTYDFNNITFSGYGANDSTDAAVFNDSGGAVTINILDGGDTPTVRNGTGASTTVVAGTVTASVNVKDLDTSTNIPGARVFVKAASGGPFPANETVTISNSGTTATVTHTAHGMATNDKVAIVVTSGANAEENEGVFSITVTGNDTYTYTMASDPGGNPTGTLTSTFVVLSGLTDDPGGNISMTRVFPSDQPVTGWVRKADSSPFYKQSAISGTVSSTAGFSADVLMIKDE